MRAVIAQLVWRWRRIPGLTRLAMLIAVVALAGLAWQYSSSPGSESGDRAAEADTAHTYEGDGHAYGEYQLEPSEQEPPPDYSPDAAMVTAGRFAGNFVSPNGNRDDWLARIGPDVMPELLDQYRLADIRNIPQTAVTGLAEAATSDPAFPTFEVSCADGQRVEVTLEMSMQGWKVSTVVPVEAPPAPAVEEPPVPGVGPAVVGEGQ